jgi:hypothetical protein
VSPELALVDPQLAAALRATSSSLGSLAHEPCPVEPMSCTRRSTVGARRAVRVGVLARSAVAVVIAAVTLTGVSAAASAGRHAAPRSIHSVGAPHAVSVGLESGAERLDHGASAPLPSRRPESAARRIPTSQGSRQFAWAPVPAAVAYRVELFRGQVRVFRSTVRRPGFVLPPRWSYSGRTMRLRPGTYRWLVWPITSAGIEQAATVQARLAVQ